MIELLITLAALGWIGFFIFWHDAGRARSYSLHVLEEWEKSTRRLMELHERVRSYDRETIDNLKQRIAELEKKS